MRGSVTVEIQAGQRLQGAQYYLPVRYDLSPAYAAMIVAQGVGKRVPS